MSVLSSDLISQFVKATNDTSSDSNSTSTMWGTVSAVDEESGTFKVLLDGASSPISVSTTVSLNVDDRVQVTLYNHTAIVTGNSTSISVDYDSISADFASFSYLTANYADINFANITTAAIENLTASEAFIESLTASEAFIESLTASEAFIEDLTATYATINFANITTAAIKNLTANEAFITSLDAMYADIDFANITTAAIKNLYSGTGLIEDLTVGDGYITGVLACVTINADLITTGTLVCSRLAITGEDGLFYYINVNAEGGLTTEEVEEIEASDDTSILYDSIHGSSIAVNTITADRINVSDLYAFDATIGGSIIEDGSIHTYAKASVDNTTSGFYLDSGGQFALGNANSYIKFYLDSSSGEYKLDISASEFTYSSSEIITSLLGNYVTYGDYGDVFYDYCVNGDFSDELDNWGMSSTASSNGYIFLSSYDDVTCVEFIKTGYYLRQSVTFSESGTVILRLKAACESGYEDSMQIRARCNTYLYSNAGEISTEWGEITLTFSDVTAGTYYVWIYAYGATASLYITDIEILGPYTRTLATTTAELKVTMDEISTSVSNLEGDVSTLSQTADAITAAISDSDGNIMYLESTAEGLEAEIEDTQSGVRTYFAASSETVTVETGSVTFSSNTFIVSSTYFSVTAAGVITATSGTIGGYTIASTYLNYNSRTSHLSATSGILLSTTGISCGNGSTWTALYGGRLLGSGGSSSSVRGYVGFNNYYTDTGYYGTRVAGYGYLELSTPYLCVSSYASYTSDSTVTVGQSGSTDIVTGNIDLDYSEVSNTTYYLYIGSGGNLHRTTTEPDDDVSYITLNMLQRSALSDIWIDYSYKSVTFTKGLMTTSL